jgi:hypothetical protein
MSHKRQSERQGLWERVQHFLKYHTDLNVRIRALKVLPGPDKNPPDFMTLLNHAAPLTQEQRPTILDALNRDVTRGDKLFTGAAKENLDMMFTKLIIHEDLPLNLGESTYFHDFILEVSKGTYKGACHDTVRALVSRISDGGQEQCRLFVSTCQRGGTKLPLLSGDL